MVIVIAIQAVIIWDGYVSWWGVKIWNVRHLPAWERTGRLPLWLGDDFTEHVIFLHDTLPEESTLLVPSFGWVKTYTPILQFMLLPRRIISCGDSNQECIQQALAAGWWILKYENFPPNEFVNDRYMLIIYKDGFGVYSPPSKNGSSEVGP